MAIDRYNEYTLADCADAPDGASFCITVTDDCMEPIIRAGERVYAACDRTPAEFEVGIFLYEGKVVCRQWCEDYAGTIHLLSANPAREVCNISVPRERREHLACLGRVMLDIIPPRPFYN
jgi:phage repressor protein C with HTH and peptisase S24 domain